MNPLYINNEGYEYIPPTETLPEFTEEELDTIERLYIRDHV
jgi:hypothetical protein